MDRYFSMKTIACKSMVLLAIAGTAMGVQAKDDVVLRRNQVGCYPSQEKVVVV